jgi:hypothetical protein
MTIEKRNVVSRRTMLQATLIAATAGLAGRAGAQQKIAQNLVQYQNTPKGDQQCDKCAQFVAPSSCKVVDGVISPRGYCVAFVPKS